MRLIVTAQPLSGALSKKGKPTFAYYRAGVSSVGIVSVKAVLQILHQAFSKYDYDVPQ